MRRVFIMLFSLAVVIFVMYIYMDTRFIFHTDVSDYYINNFVKDTWAKNAVTAIYLNYRVFDSIFETLMLLVSVVAVINFSWRKDNEE